jgi:ketosteroid isomerase-like protein
MSTATLNASLSADEVEILALNDALHKAHLEKAPEGIAAPFAPHAVIYDLEPPLMHDGISVERKRKWLEGWNTPLELIAQDFKVMVSGDHAHGYGYLRLSGTPKAAGRPISFWMRATICYQRIDGAWRIVHEHTSVPFYMDGSLRPAFDLQP